MGTERVPSAGLLVMGVLWREDGVLPDAEKGASSLFGPVSRRSEAVSFGQYTEYYQKEMGQGILRSFWAFRMPFPRGALVEAKLATNRLERALAKEGRRTVNLDPGILSPESLVLATTKPQFHRVYLSKGIFAELTLAFRRGHFQVLPWTYPDYGDEWARSFFEKARGDLMESRRVVGKKGSG